jgi:hypothetical protein
MQSQNDEPIGDAEKIEVHQRDGWAERTEKLLRQLLDGGSHEDHYGEVLEHCRREGMSQRRLWHALAISRLTNSVSCPELVWERLIGCDGERLRRRILGLIDELPAASLEEFRGLVAFTATFLSRTEFVCDLIVFLFAERERGAVRQPPDGGRYTEFFVQKLMWELDVVLQLMAERPALSQLNEGYVDWLADRILDGEVLI